MKNRKYILSGEVAEKKLRRMALEIVERNHRESTLILIGIKEKGSVIAQKIHDHLQQIFNGSLLLAELILDKTEPKNIVITPIFDFNDSTIIIIDDVANSGKTMLYALKPLLENHPKKIQTLALVERSHKSFPVEVDYVGLSVSTSLDEHIFVEVGPDNELLGAWME